MTITFLKQKLKLCPVSFLRPMHVTKVTKVIIGDTHFKEADSIFPSVSKEASSANRQKIHHDVSAAQCRGTCTSINI